MNASRTGRRRRFTPLALLTGAAGALLLSLSMTSTVSAFTASITDTGSSGTAAALAMRQTGPDGRTVCNSTDDPKSPNAATCSTIDLYGGTDTPLQPGETREVTIVVTNTGTVTPDSFSLAFGECTSTPATKGWGDLCSDDPGLQISVSLNNGDTVGPLAPIDLAGKSPFELDTLAPGERAKFTFTLSFSEKAPNNLQGAQITQPITWTFTA